MHTSMSHIGCVSSIPVRFSLAQHYGTLFLLIYGLFNDRNFKNQLKIIF